MSMTVTDWKLHITHGNINMKYWLSHRNTKSLITKADKEHMETEDVILRKMLGHVHRQDETEYPDWYRCGTESKVKMTWMT